MRQEFSDKSSLLIIRRLDMDRYLIIEEIKNSQKRDNVSMVHEWAREGGGGEGSTQIWFGQGSAAGALKSLPIFKGHFDRKRCPFLRIFLKGHFYNFQM